MSLSRRVGRNALFQVGGRLYTSALAFVITALVLPHQLAESDFGVFAFHLALYQWFTSVLDFGTGTIVVREAARRRQDAGRLIGLLVRIKGAFALLFVAVLVVVAWVFEGPGTPFLLLALGAWHLLFHAPGGAAAIFHVDMQFGRAVLASTLGQTVWLAGTALLVFLAVDRPAPYLLAFALGPVVSGVLGYAWAARQVHIRYDAGRAECADLWRQAWPAGVAMAAASTYFSIDTIMLRPMAGDVAVAHYSAAYRVMTFVLMVPVLFTQVVFPVYARLAEGDRATLAAFHERTLRFLSALGLLVPATVILVAPSIMALLYPAGYVAGTSILAVLCLAVPCVFAAYPHVVLLLSTGHQRTMMRVSVSAAVLNVAANLVAIPRWGALGAAWTTVGTEAFVLLTSAWCGARCTGVRARPSVLLRPLAAAAAAGIGLALVLRGWPAPSTPGEAAARVGLALLAAGGGVVLARVLPLDLGTNEGAPDA